MLILIISIFLINIASSVIYWDSVMQGTCIDLDQSCSTCTYVNMTMVQYPNDTIIFQDLNMIKSGNKYYYKFCDTKQLGQYHVSLQGDKDGTTQTEEGYFEVTNSGITLTTSESILYIVLIIINLLIFGFFLYYAIAIPFTNKKNERGDITKILKIKYLKLAAIWFSYASFLWFFTIFTGIINNFISLEIYNNLISNLYIIFRGIGYGLTIFLMLFTFVKIWRDILWNEEIKKFGKVIIDGRKK